MSASTGQLILVPNTLDFGVTRDGDIQEVLPLGVIRRAAGLGYWVAENAKTTRAFLKRVAAVLPLAQPLQSVSIVELPRSTKGTRSATPVDLKPLLLPIQQGHDMGLISEAGLPAVADPGALLVQTAHALNIEVKTLAGPSSLLLALAASGLNGQSFAFVGYLPIDASERSLRIRELEALSKRSDQTQIMIETPYRNAALLAALIEHLKADTRLSVSCGLTLHQAWTRTDSVARWKTSPTPMPSDIPAVFSLLAPH